VDSESAGFSLLAGLNFLTDDSKEPGRVMAALAELNTSHGFAFAGPHAPANCSREGTLLVGFTARFFKGEASSSRDTGSRSTRFGLEIAVPRCLKVPQIRGDSISTGRSALDAAREDEADLILLLEADREASCENWLRSLAMLPQTELRFTIASCSFRSGANALGYKEGLSNLQDVRRQDPERYRSYLLAGAGEDPLHQGGTYLVVRQYGYDLQRWSEQAPGKRDIIVGRSVSGQFVDSAGEEIPPSTPEAELASRIAACSHIRQVNPRGFARTQFGDAVRPPDVRILRRSSEIWQDGTPTGILFACFQSNIQHRGFEYINNNWIMASGFNSGRDLLLDPSNGFLRPGRTCYSFVPPSRSIPGDSFLSLPSR
jgi:deferrochelatase/peroxidase EfeB